MITKLVEAIVLPLTHKERFEAIGIRPPKGEISRYQNNKRRKRIADFLCRGAALRSARNWQNSDGSCMRRADTGINQLFLEYEPGLLFDVFFVLMCGRPASSSWPGLSWFRCSSEMAQNWCGMPSHWPRRNPSQVIVTALVFRCCDIY